MRFSWKKEKVPNITAPRQQTKHPPQDQSATSFICIPWIFGVWVGVILDCTFGCSKMHFSVQLTWALVTTLVWNNSCENIAADSIITPVQYNVMSMRQLSLSGNNKEFKYKTVINTRLSCMHFPLCHVYICIQQRGRRKNLMSWMSVLAYTCQVHAGCRKKLHLSVMFLKVVRHHRYSIGLHSLWHNKHSWPKQLPTASGLGHNLAVVWTSDVLTISVCICVSLLCLSP